MESETQNTSKENVAAMVLPDEPGDRQQTEMNPAHAFYAHAANLDTGSEPASSEVGSDTFDVDIDVGIPFLVGA